MTERTKALALINTPEERDQGFPPEGLTLYLMTNQLAHPSCFPATLNLASFEQEMAYLYQQNFTSPVIDEEERQVYLSKTKGSHIEEQPYFQDFINQQGEAEQGLSIYFDSETGETTAIFGVGSHTRVTYKGSGKLLDEGKLPLIRFHTHPTDTLFSSNDLVDLITKIPGHGALICKAGVVFCPNIQVLAVVTSQTRFFESTEAAKGYLSARQRHVATQVQDDPTLKRISAELDQLAGKSTSLPQQIERKIEHLKKRILSGEITGDRGLELAGLMFDAHEKAKELLDERFIKAMALERQHCLFFADNPSRIELTRTLGLKLYFSTDMRVFREFSA